MKLGFCALACALLLSGCGAPPGAPSPSQSATLAPDASTGPTQTAHPTAAPTPEPTPRPTPDLAHRLLDDMSLEDKAGQVLLMRCPETAAVAAVSAVRPGGVVLFYPNVRDRSAETLRGELQALQDASDIPLLVAGDEEGGTVTRVSQSSQLAPARFLSPKALYAQGGMDAVVQDALAKSALLLDLGINLNLAPVADVSDAGDFMFARSFSPDALKTADFVSRVVAAMNERYTALARIADVCGTPGRRGENARSAAGENR